MAKIYTENFKETKFVKIKDFRHFHCLFRQWEDCHLAVTGDYPSTMFSMSSQEVLYNYIISSFGNEDVVSFADLHKNFEQTSVRTEILKKEHEERVKFYCELRKCENLDELLKNKHAYSNPPKYDFIFYKGIYL